MTTDAERENVISQKIANLAEQVIPTQQLASFWNLSLKAQICGIGTIAIASGQKDVADMCLEFLKCIEENSK
jgi:hypothetical protein